MRLVAKTLSQSQGGRVLFRTGRKTKKDKVLQFPIFAKTLVLKTNNPNFVPLFAPCRCLRPQNPQNPLSSHSTPSYSPLTFTIHIPSTMFHQKVKSKQLPHYFQKSYASCSVSATQRVVLFSLRATKYLGPGFRPIKIIIVIVMLFFLSHIRYSPLTLANTDRNRQELPTII